MFKTSLKSLLGHKFRLAITGIAIILGVGFMAGTFVLTDTIIATFDDLFATANEGIDAVVRQEEAFDVEVAGGSTVGGSQRDDVDLSVLDTVLTAEGVKNAEPNVQGFAFVIGDDNKPVNSLTNGNPQFGSNWLDDEDISPYDLAEGRPPKGPMEAVIDRGTAKKGKLAVGDPIKVQTLAPTFTVTVVGIATFGDSDNFAGATFVLMETEYAAENFARAGKATDIPVTARPGVSQQQLVENLRQVISPGLEALTGDDYTEEQQDLLQEGIAIFNQVLSGFAFVSLIAGAFLIYNTFGIIVAQRTRELALLRALGASRRQLRLSVLLEAAVTGLLASAVGLALGVGLAVLMKAALEAFGVDLPTSSLVVAPRTVIVSLVVGLVITVVSALFPAWRASKVPPIAAIRDVAVERTPRPVARLIIGGVFALLAGASLINGVTANELVPILIGILLLFVAVVVLGPRLDVGIARVIGAWLPRVKGMTGTLARENAVRNPRRTAATSSALVLALALVTVLTIFFSSFQATINNAVEQGFKGDFQLDTGAFDGSGLSPDLTERLQDLPEVGAAGGVRVGTAQVGGKGVVVFGIDGPQIDQLIDLGVVDGSLQDLTGEDTIAIDRDAVESFGWRIGTEVPFTFPSGRKQPLRIVAVYETGGQLAQGSEDNWFLSLGAFAALEPAQVQTDLRVLVKRSEGVSKEQARTAIETVAEDYPTAEVRDLKQIQEAQTRQINQALSFFLVLLALSVVIGFFGIANTLALSVIERTRELGLLRAVGMERRQMKSMVRWEAVLIALLGTFLGVVIGIIGGAALADVATSDIPGSTIAIPWITLLIFGLVAGLFGVIAAIFPARRAARLDVLRAVTVE
ncbi:MAG: FtsX-like permease family protein [Acidimicrobiales bacterium]